jgi:hypothetical protein
MSLSTTSWFPNTLDWTVLWFRSEMAFQSRGSGAEECGGAAAYAAAITTQTLLALLLVVDEDALVLIHRRSLR